MEEKPKDNVKPFGIVPDKNELNNIKKEVTKAPLEEINKEKRQDIVKPEVRSQQNNAVVESQREQKNISAKKPFDDFDDDDMFDGKKGNTEVKKPEKVFEVRPKKEEEQKNQVDDFQNINGSPIKPKVVSKLVEEKKAEKPKDDEFEPLEDFEDDPKPKVTKIGNNRLDLNKQAFPPKVVLLY